ncbi:hypothetical protein [Rhodovastum atsumiense]|uniref:Uncharacterized protein n=1 Tax=Rhodovastum atsumiense TaxID=504468 RepID=A0A5M6IZX5_9PROT|nr:hypothetical protein [Rhodovastum atsumiense]KAA5613904.1 hypothetical protein F1189_03775 [Rhodovastum atsumiense]
MVFSDTGTYISQMLEYHLGWDRPVFYSMFLLASHWTLTTWISIFVQGVLVVSTLDLARRTIGGAHDGRGFLAILLVLAIATGLPWCAAQIMPDVFTGLLPLLLAMLVLVPERLGPAGRWWVTLFGAFVVAVHQSNLPLCLALLGVLLPLRRRLGATGPLGPGERLRIGLVPALAVAALLAMNLAGHGRLSLSPYGNVFLLARVIYDGPGLRTLQRDCPDAGWRLCATLDRPMPLLSDDFLWAADSPLARAGGAVAVSAEADAIILRSLRAEPGAVIAAAAGNTVRQLASFRTGDGLEPWPATVTPVVLRNFPRFERTAYLNSQQTQGRLVVPEALGVLHQAAALLGIAATLLGGILAARRGHPAAGLCLAVLVGVLVNAAVTGALSAPHDRYESRMAWLTLFAPMLGLALLWRRSGTGLAPLFLQAASEAPTRVGPS